MSTKWIEAWRLFFWAFSVSHPVVVKSAHHVHTTENMAFKSALSAWDQPRCTLCANILMAELLEADSGFRPAVRAIPLHGACCSASLRLAVGKAEEARHCAPVFPGHGVVEDGVDGCTQVEENHGHQTAVLGQHRQQWGGGVPGAELHVATHMERQPAQDKGQHDYHCRRGRRRGSSGEGSIGVEVERSGSGCRRKYK